MLRASPRNIHIVQPMIMKRAWTDKSDGERNEIRKGIGKS